MTDRKSVVNNIDCEHLNGVGISMVTCDGVCGSRWCHECRPDDMAWCDGCGLKLCKTCTGTFIANQTCSACRYPMEICSLCEAKSSKCDICDMYICMDCVELETLCRHKTC